MSDSVRLDLAQRRASELLSQLSPRQSAKEQRRIILKQWCSHFPPLDYGGPVFELEILLEDPGFCLPGRSRADTERIVAEGVQGAKAGLASFAKGQPLQFVSLLLAVTIALAGVAGGFWGLTHLLQIGTFIESFLR